MGMFNLIVMGIPPVGGMILGILSDGITTPAAIMASGGGYLIATALLVAAVPAIWQLPPKPAQG